MDKIDRTNQEKPVLSFGWVGVVEGFRRCLPIALGVFIYGLVFGVLAQQAGLSIIEALLMSGLVFAGASQFAALKLWTIIPLPTPEIILTTLIVNLRHVLMGAAVQPWFASLKPWQRYLSVFFMTDENWALTMSEFKKGKRNGAMLLGSGLALFLAWTGSTLAGRALGSVLQDPAKWGLDFAFTAVFITLLVGMWRGKSDILPWLIAAAVAIAASQLIPGNWYILLGGLAGSLAGAWRK